MNQKKKLGFGLMRLPLLDPNDATSIDMECTKEMVDAFLERGFTYFDTAWMYCGFKSECAAKEALVDRHPRDSFTLATKLHAGYLKTEEDRDRIFEEQMRKTGVSTLIITCCTIWGPTTWKYTTGWIALPGCGRKRPGVW